MTHTLFDVLAKQNEADYYARADHLRLVAELRCGADQPTRWHRRRLARLLYTLAERLDPQHLLEPQSRLDPQAAHFTMRPAGGPMEACS